MKNKTNYYNSKPKEKKWVGKLVAVVATVLALGVGVSALGIGTTGFKDWSFSRWFPKTETVAPAPEASEGGAVINEGENNGMRLMSARVMAADYDEYGISPLAENAYTLSVTYTPEATTLKKTTFKVAFKDPVSKWATGKNVSDYVTVTSTGDTTATLTVLQPFSEQIIVTAECERNPDIKATTTVDYVGTPYFECERIQAYQPGANSIHPDYTHCMVFDSFRDFLGIGCPVNKECIFNGTIVPDLAKSITLEVALNDGEVNAIKAMGYNCEKTVMYDFGDFAEDGDFEIDFFDEVLTKATGESWSNAAFKNDMHSIFYTDEQYTTIFETFKLTAHRVYNGTNYGDVVLAYGDIEIADLSNLEVNATSMTTNTPTIVAG